MIQASSGRVWGRRNQLISMEKTKFSHITQKRHRVLWLSEQILATLTHYIDSHIYDAHACRMNGAKLFYTKSLMNIWCVPEEEKIWSGSILFIGCASPTVSRPLLCFADPFSALSSSLYSFLLHQKTNKKSSLLLRNFCVYIFACAQSRQSLSTTSSVFFSAMNEITAHCGTSQFECPMCITMRGIRNSYCARVW